MDRRGYETDHFIGRAIYLGIFFLFREFFLDFPKQFPTHFIGICLGHNGYDRMHGMRDEYFGMFLFKP
jgi:hypothetical protein